jgi:isoleucyl-tRNA synthetase
MKGFREWGIMADWDKAWRTMDKSFEMKQLAVFQEMVRKGLIFRRYKPVYWSPSSKTALAEAELEYKDDHISISAYVKFPITNLSETLKRLVPDISNLSALIWTTTPWTLPANKAIAYNKDIDYSLIKCDKDHLIVAQSRLPMVLESCFKDKTVDVLVPSIPGSDLQGLMYTNQLRGQTSDSQPLIHADFVSADSGTGLVHCAPGHGMDDYEVCTRLGIEAMAPVDNSGCFTDAALPENPTALAGKPVLGDGTLQVLSLLGDQVLFTSNYKHKYPYDWRTKLPVIVRATEQWFADVEDVKSVAMSRLSEVTFIPPTGKHRLESFVKSRSEWCISRQRAWGVPIPALYDEDGIAVLTDTSVAHILSIIDARGIDAWWSDPEDDPAWIPEGLKGGYRRGKDTMDVWFDSGTSWTQTEQQADVYSEGTDQHRGWFQSSLLTHTSVSKDSVPPMKTLITHGFTLDQSGRKMSKSIGNTIAPSQIMDGSLLPPAQIKRKGGGASQGLGADALRLWVASSDYTKDVVIGQPVLASINSALLKYRITFKMLLGSMHESARNAPVTKLDIIALAQLNAVMKEVNSAYEAFEFHKAINAINRWIHTDLSAFYLEASKDRLYCGDGGGVLEPIFHGLLRMLAPITPSLVEEVWSHLPAWMQAEEQIHPLQRTLNHDIIPLSLSPAIVAVEKDVPWLMNAMTAIKVAQELARRDKIIGSSLESSVVLILPEQARNLFEGYAEELESIFVVSSVSLGGECEGDWKFSAQFDAPGGKAIAWVLPPRHTKCPRCWRYVAPAQDELCKRCEEVTSII